MFDELKNVPKSVWIVAGVLVVVVLALANRASASNSTNAAGGPSDIGPNTAATNQAAIAANATVDSATVGAQGTVAATRYAAATAAFGDLASGIFGVQNYEVTGNTQTNISAINANSQDTQSLINANERAIESGYQYDTAVAGDRAATTINGQNLQGALAATEAGRQIGLSQTAAGISTTQIQSDQAIALAQAEAAANADNNRTALAIARSNNDASKANATTAAVSSGANIGSLLGVGLSILGPILGAII